jgi:16S rRNA (uracil1498-N3)-methyltransferase
MSSYLVSPQNIHGKTATIVGGEADHAIKSARRRLGDSILLIDGSGVAYRSTVASIEPRRLICNIVEVLPEMGEPILDVTLAAGLTKGDRFEDMIEKATELGVGSVLPLETRYTVARQPSENKRRRWETIAESAAKQCLRSRVPTIMEPVDLAALIPHIPHYGEALLAWEGETTVSTAPRSIAGGRSILVVIGPEGGFHPDEIRDLQTAGARTMPLGARRLRAETAAITALTLVLEAVGEYSRLLPPHVD